MSFRLAKGIGCIGLCLSLSSVSSHALILTWDRGEWSPDWPKELESLRQRATSESDSPIGGGIFYTIPFREREEFEKVWPTVLGLKSKGTALVLKSGPVQISHLPTFILEDISPATSQGTTTDGDTPISLRVRESESEVQHLWPAGGYAGIRIHAPQSSMFPRNDPRRGDPQCDGRVSTIEIELFVDGKIIDLNRIHLPADIKDERALASVQATTTQPTTR